jgi:hypothetical protein
LTSLPAPSTVLQPHNVASNAAASNALSVFTVTPLFNINRRTQLLRIPSTQRAMLFRCCSPRTQGKAVREERS